MLRFTPAGVVRAPVSVQVRIGNTFDGRLRAGAPVPSRALTDVEVMENVQHFTEGMRGPRSVPCTELVLTGVPPGRLAGLAPVLERARAWGIARVVLHVAPGTEPVDLDVDAVVMPVRAASQPRVLARWRVARTAVVPLDRRTLGTLDELVDAVLAAPPERLVLTWPFPPAATPAPVHEVVAALDRAAPRLDGLTWALKGLPACLVGPHGARVSASHNRWYVDADHPKDRALLFFPDVVRFFKAESCRFCRQDAACDGVALRWQEEGRVPPLRPVGG